MCVCVRGTQGRGYHFGCLFQPMNRAMMSIGMAVEWFVAWKPSIRPDFKNAVFLSMNSFNSGFFIMELDKTRIWTGDKISQKLRGAIKPLMCLLIKLKSAIKSSFVVSSAVIVIQQ